MKANHEDAWVAMTTGRGETQVFVKRGQFIFGRKTAARELKMSEGTVRGRMGKLANMQNLVIESATHYSIVTVLNYRPYQDFTDTKAPGNSPTNRQPTATNNNVNNENKKIGRSKEPDPRVKEFFDHWEETFLQETGQPYVFNFAKEGQLIKNLLRVHDLPILQDAARGFFQDEQCKRRGLTIGIFFQEINRLLSLKAMSPLEQAKRELRTRYSDKG
jgi:hypothetical protein